MLFGKKKEVKKDIKSKSQLASEGKVIAPKKMIFRYRKPPISLLSDVDNDSGVTREELMESAYHIKEVFWDLDVLLEPVSISRGPSVTRYEFEPEQNAKLSEIKGVIDEFKFQMGLPDVRMEIPVSGKRAIAIEVPNDKRDMVSLKELLISPELANSKSPLAFPVGKGLAGDTVVGDLIKMPHMLIAGTTGSGKSVFTNSILMSILYRTTPNDVRVLVIDPKIVEFQAYNGIPHLLYPVVTDPKRASGILMWAVAEMQNRYKQLADAGVKDIAGYNEKVRAGETDARGNQLEKMPYLLIIIDELADLMMVAAKEVESSIVRLAQLARAAGIHMVLATQRPSTDVVTGLIKANIPSRVALTVASHWDSRTIIDNKGAEKLLGNGDMLFYPPEYRNPVRLQGAFVSEKEIEDTVRFIKENSTEPVYSSSEETSTRNAEKRDPLFEEAGRLCIQRGKGSTSIMQRTFRIGFKRAANLMNQLYDAGVVGPEEINKPRKVLMSMEEFESIL